MMCGISFFSYRYFRDIKIMFGIIEYVIGAVKAGRL